MKIYNLKNDAMKKMALQKVYNYPIYPRDSKIHSEKGFVNIDKVSMGGSHWCSFYVKDNKFYCFDSFGGQADNFLLKQLPKPLFFHIYKIQYINFKICGSYCLCFMYLTEKMDYYDVLLKKYFA